MDVRKDRLMEMLLVRSFQYREEPPFVLASGKTSPYYVNCKAVTLSAEGLTLIGALGYEALKHSGVVATGGLTLGADPIACAIAQHSFGRSRPLSAFVVRKEAKGHGMQRFLEGELEPASSVAVIDDVITTGGSTLTAVERIRAAGHTVEHAVVLVDREEGGREALEAAGLTVHALVTRTELMARLQLARKHAQEL